MNVTLDVVDAIRATLDAVDLVMEHALRTTRTVEAQRAATAAKRARARLDALSAGALQEVG